MLSTPSLSFGCLNLAFLGGYEALPALFAAAAFPCSAAIPAAPKRAAVTTTAAAASNTGRPVRDSLSRTRFFMVFLSEQLISRGLETPAKRRLFPQRRIDAPPRALPEGSCPGCCSMRSATTREGCPRLRSRRHPLGATSRRGNGSRSCARGTSSLQGAGKDAHVDAALGDQDPRCVDPD